MAAKKKLLYRLIGIIVSIILAPAARPASALAPVDIQNDRATLDFPNAITFQAELTAPDPITSVILEYGDQEQTCGQVEAKAYPEITPGKDVQAEWTWDMRQSGSLPPGTQIWWRWRVTDESGKTTVSDQKTVLWLDQIHSWQLLTKGDIRLHWYENNQGYAQDLLNAAYNGLSRIEKDAGLSNDQPIDLYIYANTQDMQNAILYEPSWTGGEAFPEQNIVILGISPAELTWGRKSEVHELTHVLVGHFTFTCMGYIPTWLNEGLAVYSEGDLDPDAAAQLNDAIQNDTLLPVRSLSGPFSEVSSKAYLSYSESYSIVKFLIERDGRDKMTALLEGLRDGQTVDEALTAVYGFNIEGLEDQWRSSIGAKARAVVPHPTAVPSPTIVPTIIPVSGALQAVTPTPFSFPTPEPAGRGSNAPPLSLTLVLIFSCCALAAVLGVIIIAFVVAMQNRKKGGENETHS